jgi:hypothetical protein
MPTRFIICYHTTSNSLFVSNPFVSIRVKSRDLGSINKATFNLFSPLTYLKILLLTDLFH